MVIWIVVGVVSLLSFLVPTLEQRHETKAVVTPPGFEEPQPVIYPAEFEAVRK